MNYPHNTIVAIFVTITALSSCDSTYQEQTFNLTELGYSLVLPGNSTIAYHAPSFDGASLKYNLVYNDGNGNNSKVEVTVEEAPKNYSENLNSLVAVIEKQGGIIDEKFHYDNGVWGCTYTNKGKKVFEFVITKKANETYVLKPNEIYNTEHKYLDKILKAIESIKPIENK